MFIVSSLNRFLSLSAHYEVGTCLSPATGCDQRALGALGSCHLPGLLHSRRRIAVDDRTRCGRGAVCCWRHKCHTAGPACCGLPRAKLCCSYSCSTTSLSAPSQKCYSFPLACLRLCPCSLLVGVCHAVEEHSTKREFWFWHASLVQCMDFIN